jgi:hypothetical protein
VTRNPAYPVRCPRFRRAVESVDDTPLVEHTDMA